MFDGERDSEDSYEEAKQRMSATHTVAGKGSYGIAFNGAEGQVIKLHPKEDRAYVAFIKWVQSLRGEDFKKHFPKILFFQDRGNYITVIMEKLFHFHDLPKVERDALPNAISPVQGISLSEAMEQAKNRLIWSMNDRRNQSYMFPKSWGKFQVTSSLEAAFQAILMHVYNNDFACDLHDENIMFRRTPSGLCVPVIIDPFTC